MAGVPLIATRIPGTIGLLGADYPGYFPVGETQQLARLLARAETEAEFLKTLRSAVRRHSPLFDPQRERRAWADLLAEIKTPG